MDPAQRFVLQRLGETFRNDAVEQGQPDEHVGIFVRDLHKLTAHIHMDGQLLRTFPHQSLLHGLAGLHFAADELPQKPTGLVFRPLADQKFVLLPNQSSHNIHGLVLSQHSGRNGGNPNRPFRTGQSFRSRDAILNVHIPASFGQSYGHVGSIRIEDSENILLFAIDLKGYHVRIVHTDGMYLFPDLVPGHQPKGRVGFPESDQSPVKCHIALILFLVQVFPFQRIDLIGRTVAVVVKAALLGRLGPQHFLTGLHKGNTLGQEGKGRRQIVHLHQHVPGRFRRGQANAVKEGVVIMAGDVVHTLVRLCRPQGHTHKAGFQLVLGANGAADESGSSVVKHRAPQQIPNRIAEEGESRHFGGIALYGQIKAGLGQLGIHAPALAVENDVGVGLVNGMNDLVDGLHIDQAHQIEAEAVDVILVRPVVEGIHQILAHHDPLGGGIVAAAGAVGIHAVFVDPAEISGHNLVKAEIPSLKNMVVDHVHNHADAVVVQSLHHLLHFLHTDGAVVGIRSVGTFGNIEVHRVIAPVELRIAAAFIGIAVVKNRQQMQMGDAQVLDVVQTGRLAGFGFLSGFRHTQELALILDPGAAVHGKVTDVKLVDKGVGNVDPGVGIAVLFPAVGIGAVHIDDHGPFAVDAGGLGIGVAGLTDLTVHQYKVGVVDPIQIAHTLRDPGTVDIGLHVQLREQVVGAGRTAAVKVDGDLFGSGSPDPEGRLLGRPDSAQIAAGIGIFFFKCVGRVEIEHCDGTPYYIKITC